MNSSITDEIFIDNAHLMFGQPFLLNTINTVFNGISPEFKLAMNNKLYNNNEEEQLRITCLLYTSPSPRD